MSRNMDDGAAGDWKIVCGRRISVRGMGDGERRGGSDGVWRRDVLVGRPLMELRGVEQAGRLMMNSSMTPEERMARGEAN